MSDATEEPPRGGKGDGKNGESRDLTEPQIRDRGLYEYFIELFEGDSGYPERIEVNVVSGAHKEKIHGQVLQRVFAPPRMGDEAIKRSNGAKKKPSAEDLVSLTNNIVARIQRDCDEARKPLCYGVHAYHSARNGGDLPYARHLKSCRPQGRFAKEGAGPDEDDDALTRDQRFANQYSQHHERLFQIYHDGYIAFMDRDDRIIERLLSRNEQLENKNSQILEMLERSLNFQAERNERLEWVKLKTKSVERMLDLGSDLLPPLLAGAFGKGAPGLESAEAKALKKFLTQVEDGGKLTRTEAERVFGAYDEDGQCTKPGLLTHHQCSIILGVAFKNWPNDQLDQLLPDGEHAITPEQAMELQNIFGLERLAPILLILQSRQKKAPKT